MVVKGQEKQTGERTVTGSGNGAEIMIGMIEERGGTEIMILAGIEIMAEREETVETTAGIGKGTEKVIRRGTEKEEETERGIVTNTGTGIGGRSVTAEFLLHVLGMCIGAEVVVQVGMCIGAKAEAHRSLVEVVVLICGSQRVLPRCRQQI